MDQVYVLTKESHEYEGDIYILSSSNIHDLLEYILNHQGCCENFKVFVTDFNQNNINYLEWRKR